MEFSVFGEREDTLKPVTDAGRNQGVNLPKDRGMIAVPAVSAGHSLPASERVYLWVEYLALFFVLPGLLLLRDGLLPFFPVLLLATAGCLTVLLRDRTFERRQLWNWGGSRQDLWRLLGVFLVAGGALAAATWFVVPERWLSLPRERPGLWTLIMFAYPVLSVFPQEVIWRAFHFHRYEGIFRRRGSMIVASAVSFGFVHLLLENWLAVGLTLVGGALFAWTYDRTRSTLAVSIEHALYGCLVFTIGIGDYLVLNAGMR
jgi:membrane protease YdiL (CAAX protease family)